jgi:hypothetical protein
VIDLNDENPDVNLVPRYGLKHLEFSPFNVQAANNINYFLE